MLKVGIAGTGGISQAHGAAWAQVPEARLAAACDIRPEKAEGFARRTGAKVYLDLDEMLEKEPLDILDICLPTYLHADVAVRALEKGIHVLTEKPVSLRKEDARRVYDAAAQNGVRVMVAQVLRFWPEYVYLKEAYDSGKFGRLLSGQMTRLGNTPKWSWDSWMTDPARSGLVPFDLHIHDLDFMVYAFGRPESASCLRAKAERQDYLQAVYKYHDFFISGEAAWYDGEYPFRCGFRFQFEQALLEYSGGKLTVYGREAAMEPLAQDQAAANGINLPDTDAYYNEIRYFTDCVLAGKDCDKVKPGELETVLELLERF